MYGLPKDFDATRFVGCTLEQVSFSANTVHLSFEERVSITIESSFSHSSSENSGCSELMRVPPSESRLMQLVGKRIEHAQGDEDGTLTLRFSNDHILVCHDDLPMYEAYRMTFGDEEIIV